MTIGRIDGGAPPVSPRQNTGNAKNLATGNFYGRDVRQISSSAAYRPTHAPAPASAAAPSWIPHGSYDKNDVPNLVGKLRDYAIFLAKNPQEMTPDVKTRFRIEQGGKPSFVEVLGYLMVKHIRGYQRPIPGHPPKSQASQAMIAGNAMPLPKSAPHDGFVSGAEKTPQSQTPSFQIRVAQKNAQTFHARQTPDPVQAGERFYHERQASNEKGNLSGMHAINAFLGGHVLTRGFYGHLFAEHLTSRTEMSSGAQAELRQSLAAEPGSGVDHAAHMITVLSRTGGFDPSLARARYRHVAAPQEPRARQEWAARMDSYPGDRLIIGEGEHLIALRKNADGDWIRIDSRDSRQQRVALGGYLAGLRGEIGIVATEPFDFGGR